jgi:hypothetical protein
VTDPRSSSDESNWRRRLLPAALLLVAAYLAALAWASASSHDRRRAEPAAGRPLPAAALAGERPPAAPPQRHRRARAHRLHRRARAARLVDVVDRDAPPPRRITIPAIGVSARLVPLRLDADGRMQTPARWEEAGWFEPGREPGERGPAVIAGHVDSKAGPAVFYRLRDLRRGDFIHIRRANGSVVRFRVEGLERWPKAEFPAPRVFGRTRISTLRLVTCSGDFDPTTGHYVDNTIVYAVRVPVRRD